MAPTATTTPMSPKFRSFIRPASMSSSARCCVDHAALLRHRAVAIAVAARLCLHPDAKTAVEHVSQRFAAIAARGIAAEGISAMIDDEVARSGPARPPGKARFDRAGAVVTS